ncbi:MAG: peroxiredoxin family protein [Acidiferrobacteraceae bacterium]|nr:peroxiredoxin family protein [Acidiferrobacteraceae bacterium]|tara:strand:+ start:27476 stop:27958 length:483 start_codon:yes stop_codon:yes gene_type:complete
MKHDKALTLIASKGTLDWAYPPFVLASTAAAAGYQVTMFFTFYGLQLLRRDLNLKISALGNPAMPMPMGMNSWMPIIGTALPGMESIMTKKMKETIKLKGIATIEELRDFCLEAKVKMIGCQMSIELFEMKRSDFIDGIEIGGAATWMETADKTTVNLFI